MTRHAFKIYSWNDIKKLFRRFCEKKYITEYARNCPEAAIVFKNVLLIVDHGHVDHDHAAMIVVFWLLVGFSTSPSSLAVHCFFVLPE